VRLKGAKGTNNNPSVPFSAFGRYISENCVLTPIFRESVENQVGPFL
jgi:hypothetical protein